MRIVPGARLMAYGAANGLPSEGPATLPETQCFGSGSVTKFLATW
jgi:hypothetical protein